MVKIRVLIADDNRPMRERIVSMLESEFDVVKAVSDGQEVVTGVAELHPDVVVLDISMPVLNGIEAARQVAELNGNTRVVFVTVKTDAPIVHAALATGALGYVLKPRLGPDLVLAIKSALAGRRFVSPGLEQNLNRLSKLPG
jgi:DNA-binding NarL/FixJ family response regulator